MILEVCVDSVESAVNAKMGELSNDRASLADKWQGGKGIRRTRKGGDGHWRKTACQGF